ncbi:TonB-dependent receptor SusC precursor [mine drainage metagenome]|uniref:TonB-dependent receptor SusC n=1 Tax=mine drainage metagenome TaxID=410659 RepID=A0A1J5RHB8_9ZZZZ
MRTILIVLAVLANIGICKASDDKSTAKANITNITVYRLGAEIQQSFKATVKKETQYIEISNVSNSLEKNSLQIKSDNNITILGFEFSNTFLNPEIKSAEYQKLEDSINKIVKEVNKLNSNSSTLKDLLSVLNSNKDIKGNQTGLNVTELIKLMDFYKSKSTELKNGIADIDEKIIQLNEIKSKLNNQLDEERKKNTQKGGKLVIQISCAIAGTYEFKINYLTPNASWQPFYDIKTQNINSPFDLIYKAKISQTTGIDWNQVKLKLSTALPNQFGNAPILQTWFLQYVEPLARLYKAAPVMAYDAAKMSTMELKEGIRIRGSNNLNESSKPIYVVNGNVVSEEDFKDITPQSIKSINVLKGENATSKYGSRASAGAIEITLKDELSDYVTVQDNTLTTVYDIDIPFDIATNGKDQVATLQTQKVDAKYVFYSIPKLNDNVYLVAQVPNWNKLNLLDGEANLFFENTYVGKTDISSTSVEDTFNLTVATDKRILVKREKLKDFSSTQFLSNYKKEIFTYEITVKNNKNQAASMTIKDQYPISSNKEIEVELLENSNASINAENGELKWDVTLQPNEQKKIRFQYSVKYPKDKKLNL